MIRVFKHCKYKHPSKTFAITILNNLCIDYNRRRQTKIKKVSVESVIAIEEPHSESFNVETVWVKSLLERGLLSLPIKQREVFLDKHRGVTGREWESIHGLSANTYKNRVHRAKKKLAEFLTQHGESRESLVEILSTGGCNV